MVIIKVQPVTDGKPHTIYILSKVKDVKETATAGIGYMQFNAK
jgi:hypothetical protein